jgi:hypothetical protein
MSPIYPTSYCWGSLRGQVAGSVITTRQGGIGHNGLWSRPCVKKGKVKEMEEQRTSCSGAYEASEQNVRALASGYGAEGVCLGSTKAHSATQSNSPGNLTRSPRRQRQHTKKRSRQRSKLAEGSQEGEKGSRRKTKVKSGRQDTGGEGGGAKTIW